MLRRPVDAQPSTSRRLRRFAADVVERGEDRSEMVEDIVAGRRLDQREEPDDAPAGDEQANERVDIPHSPQDAQDEVEDQT